MPMARLPRIRIDAYRRHSFPEQRPVPTVMPWLDSYYQGMLTPYGIQTDPVQMASGRNNSFLAMASHVLKELHEECPLTDTGLFLMAHQTLDTFHPFQSTTTLLCRAFGINAPAVALTEQERSTPCIGLTVLLAALRQPGFEGAGLLLVLDQATQPYRGDWHPRDSIDNALVLRLKAAGDDAGTSLEGRRFWRENGVADAAWITQCIYAWLDTARVEMSAVDVVADGALAASLSGAMPAARVHETDRRYMSSADLVAVLDALEAGARNVLLTHLARDGHLYLFLFRQESQCST
ncbi:hypothetical protein [Uliginosibacterium sp. H1]|uniref:hypothetical protein n=1 Tax=Uliginosibacterium sp. H1 TaxID=3114757 RepID=UPI002E16F9F2|nr:hypothetical protein [Uliginosibacterium sp. H1]